MYEISKFSTVNIREYLAESKDAEIGEDVLLRIFSDFSCPINPDVEQFLKERAIEFTKKNQSVTYLVISSDDGELLGYFTIAVKPITLVVRLEEKSQESVNWMRRVILTIYQHI